MSKAYKIGINGFLAGEIEVNPTDKLMRNYTFTAPPEGKTVKWEHGAWVEAVKVAPSTPFLDIDSVTKELKEERNKLLLESDWTQLSDSPLEDKLKEDWAVYRQALRDLTEQEGFPLTCVFPNKPV